MIDIPSDKAVLLHRAKRWWWLAAVVALSAIGGWLLTSTSGLQWLASAATRFSAGGVSLTGVSGSLLGSMGAQTLILDNRSDLRITAHDVKIDWRAVSLLSGKLEIKLLQAREIEVLSLPSPYPQDLRPPMPVSIDKLDIGALQVIFEAGGSPAFAASNLSAKLESDGQRYRLDDLRASIEYGTLTASGRIEGSRPFALQAQAELVGVANFAAAGNRDAHIAASIGGDLQKIEISAKGDGAGLTGSGEAQLTPYGDFPLAALRLQVNGLDPRAFSPTAPKANLSLQADLHGNADGRLEGDVRAKNLIPAPLDRDGLPMLDGQAHATLSADLLKFDKLALALAGGATISGDVEWQRVQPKGWGELAISHLDPAALDTRLRAARLNGRMKLGGDSQVQRGEIALSDGKLKLDALLIKSAATLTLEKLRLARGQAALSGQGELALSGRRAYRFDGQLQRFDLAAFLSAPRTDLNASLALAGELEPQVSGTASFRMNASRFADQPVSGAGRIEFAGMDKAKVDAEFRLGDNRLTAKGGFGSASERLQLDLAAPALAQFGSGFGGALNAQASLSGSLAKPDASFTAEGRKLSMPGEHRLAGFTASMKLQGDALMLNLAASDYRAGADSSSESGPDHSTELRAGPSAELRAGFKSLQLAANGSRSRHAFDADALLHDGSKLTLRAHGGLVDSAQGLEDMRWQGALTELSGTGALPFKLLADTPLMLSRNRIALEAAAFAVTNGQLRIESLAWTPQRWHSRGNFTGIGLRAGVGFKPNFRVREGREFLRLGGEWDISSAAQLEGTLRVARESGDWVLPGDTPLPLGLKVLEFSARAAHGKVSGELTAQGEHLGEWRAGIAMPLTPSGVGWTVSDHAPLAGKIHIAASDLSWLGAVINDDLKTAGRLALDADIAGTYASPRLLGQVRGDDLSLALLDQGVRLEQGTLAARFDQKSLHIDTLNFVAPHEPQPRDSLLAGMNPLPGPGKLSASGVIDLSGNKGDLEISATRMPLSQRRDRWIIASGSGHIGIDNNRLSLAGSITADAGLISQPVSSRPQLSEDIVIVGRKAVASKGPRLSVDATLNLGEHFYLRASGLEARLAGQLSVRDTQGQQLRVSGSITASDATFEAYGQRLMVERGIVNFQGPLSDPGLNILALRKGLSVEAGVEVTGTALHPSVRLVSTPTVPDFEKLSWIVLGRLPTTGGADTSLLFTAAGSILGGQSGGITGQLKQSLGIDELSLRQGESAQSGSDNPLSSQIATVGKRLSSRAFLSYEQGVTAVAGVTKLTYTLTPRVDIVTQAGVESAIDVFYTFSFD